MSHITQEQAHAMGAKGVPATEDERLLFEAWMRGHCWALSATWNGTSYISDTETSGGVDPHAIRTRGLWAAWRDRAALAQPEPTLKWCGQCGEGVVDFCRAKCEVECGFGFRKPGAAQPEPVELSADDMVWADTAAAKGVAL